MDLTNKQQLALAKLRELTLKDRFPTAWELGQALTWSVEDVKAEMEVLVAAGAAGVIPPGGRNPTVTDDRYIWSADSR